MSTNKPKDERRSGSKKLVWNKDTKQIEAVSTNKPSSVADELIAGSFDVHGDELTNLRSYKAVRLDLALEKVGALERELAWIDEALARRSALDGFDTRYKKILHACEIAKKAEQLEWEVTTQEKRIVDLERMITAANGQVEVLREALEFYADPETYHAVAFIFDRPCGGFDTDFDGGHNDYDRQMPGKCARVALAASLLSSPPADDSEPQP